MQTDDGDGFLPPIAAETVGAVRVWRLPGHVSQSRLGDRPFNSHACTIIALKTAEYMQRRCFSFPTRRYATRAPPPQPPPPLSRFRHAGDPPAFVYERTVGGASPGKLTSLQGSAAPWPSSPPALSMAARTAMVGVIANSIVDGNEIHERAMRRRSRLATKFTIPDAIRACGDEFDELAFASPRGRFADQLALHVRRATHFWDGPLRMDGCVARPPLLLLVIAYQRSVLLVYEPLEQTVGVVDSHSHGDDGALFAVAPLANLDELADWMGGALFAESRSTAYSEFEISALLHRPTVEAARPPCPQIQPRTLFAPLDQKRLLDCSSGDASAPKRIRLQLS